MQIYSIFTKTKINGPNVLSCTKIISASLKLLLSAQDNQDYKSFSGHQISMYKQNACSKLTLKTPKKCMKSVRS